MKKQLYPPSYFNISVLIMLLLHFLFPVQKFFYGFWKLLGIPPLIVGVVLNLLADKEIKNNNTTVKPYVESNYLIVNGVFKISRNPMYLGMVLILVSIGIFLGTISTFIVIPIFVYTMNSMFIGVEENMLSNKFGDLWNEYIGKTRRWI